ncbi:MAG: pyridoxamine 5'-phosphate oxidase family protein [Selenomonadaceae bacterium]|nr:pyridoxamine 5'-phosphate oxidase family protein [Selenomonadaceae bacterium]
MFREMRRSKQQLNDEATKKILTGATGGVLALDGDDGYTYALPISFAYDDTNQKIYFHSAIKGHKIDAIKNNSKVSFCVIDQDQIVGEKFTTYFKSAIVFGRIKIIDDNNDPEKRRGLEILSEKYSPTVSIEKRDKVIESQIKALVVMVLEIDHMTGKQAKELIN